MLGPTLFLVFVNDLDMAAEINKFADDTNIYMVTETEEDRVRFQAMLTNLEN